MPRLSVSPPLSPRATQARNARSRRSRRGEKAQERHDQAARQGDDVALLAALGRRLRRGGDEVGRQPLEIVRPERHRPGLLVGEHVLAEGGAEARQPLHHRLQPVAVGPGQPGAGPDEHPVVERRAPAPARASGRAPSRRLVERVDAGEERRVHHRLGVVRGEPRAQARAAAPRSRRWYARRRARRTPPPPGRAGACARSIASMVLAKLGGAGSAGDRVDVRPRLGERRVEGRARSPRWRSPRRAAARRRSSSRRAGGSCGASGQVPRGGHLAGRGRAVKRPAWIDQRRAAGEGLHHRLSSTRASSAAPSPRRCRPAGSRRRPAPSRSRPRRPRWCRPG